MTFYNTKTIGFSRCNSRKVQANFDSGKITSDTGAILLNRADKMIGLTNDLLIQSTIIGQFKNTGFYRASIFIGKRYCFALGSCCFNTVDFVNMSSLGIKIQQPLHLVSRLEKCDSRL